MKYHELARITNWMTFSWSHWLQINITSCPVLLTQKAAFQFQSCPFAWSRTGSLCINLGPSLDSGTNECLKLNLRQLGCLLYVIGFLDGSNGHNSGWMRGNVGGLGKCNEGTWTEESQMFHQTVWIIRYHSILRWEPVQHHKLAFPPSLFSPLRSSHGRRFDSRRERDLLHNALRHGCFRVKIQTSGSEN